MKNLCIALALAAAVVTGTATVAAATETNSDQATSTDPNFRWHNGQWWYWQAPQSRWMVWDGSQWNVHEPRRAVRSFSYMQDNLGTPSVGSSQSVRPRSSASRITNSFGHRGAASKVRGNY